MGPGAPVSRVLSSVRGAVRFHLPQFPTPGHGDRAQLSSHPSESLQKWLVEGPHQNDFWLLFPSTGVIPAPAFLLQAPWVVSVWGPAGQLGWGVELGRAGVCPSL